MPTPTPLQIAQAAHPRSTVRDADLQGTAFTDVNLSGATFDNVDLGGAVLCNVSLRGVAVRDAALEGATIDGVLVSELFAAHAWWLRQTPRPGAD